MPYAGFDADREYLIGKFRHPVLDPVTGLDNEALAAAVEKLAMTMPDQPWPVVKARCFELIAEKMQIDVNPHDDFPAFACYDRSKRPMAGLLRQRHAGFDRLFMPEEAWEIQARNAAGLQMMWKDFDHSVPDWEAVLSLGFPGLLKRVGEYRAKHAAAGELTPQKQAYFDGIEITYSAILKALGRFIDFARERHSGDPRMKREIRCLEQLRTGAPRDTYEVLQIIYLYFMFSEHLDHMQVRSLGNLDQMIGPYFARDLAEKRYTMEEMREFWCCFFMQWGSINNYWGHPFFLGGTRADGTTGYNELSYFILEIMDDLAIPSPKIQLKIADNTPQKLLDTVCDMIRRGHSSYVFVSENAIRRIFLAGGYDEEQARTCNISGCYEIAPRACANGTVAGHVNFLKPFELVFHDGTDPKTGFHADCGAMKLADIRDFGDFYRAYRAYLREATEAVIRLADAAEKDLAWINPGQVYSGTIASSLEKAEDAFATGCRFNHSGILAVGIGSAVDCLMAVKELVFEKHELTLAGFREILDADWKGHEELLDRVRRLPCKYGNGLPEADQYAYALAHYFGSIVNGRPNARGGHYGASGHCAKQYFELGKRTGATPDGRRAGEEMSKNLSPAMGADRHGVTALVRSCTAMDPGDLPGDFPLDVMMLPSSVQGEEGLAAMSGIIRTYFARHGHAIHFNIFDASVLEDAQLHPENYAGLQVRVCGWNVHFTEMAKAEQDAYICRAQNLME